MRPIVDGLQDDYDEQVTFVYLNAKDREAGEVLFQSLGLPGHPSIVIFTPDGEEIYRRFGIADETELIDILNLSISLD